MINFKLLNNSEPYKIFKSFYDKAHSSNQESIEAVSISSYETNSNEVNSRYVNLKYIDDEDKFEEKLEQFRCKEIKALLVDEYLRETNNEKLGNQSLTKYFIKK